MAKKRKSLRGHKESAVKRFRSSWKQVLMPVDPEFKKNPIAETIRPSKPLAESIKDSPKPKKHEAKATVSCIKQASVASKEAKVFYKWAYRVACKELPEVNKAITSAQDKFLLDKNKPRVKQFGDKRLLREANKINKALNEEYETIVASSPPWEDSKVVPIRKDIELDYKSTSTFDKNMQAEIDKAAKPSGYSFAYKKPVVKTGLAPSGKPISLFTTPTRRSKTNSGPPEGVMSAYDMTLIARNDPSFAPAVKDVQWYINNYKPDDWPEEIVPFVQWTATGPKPNVNAIKQPVTHKASEAYRIAVMQREVNMLKERAEKQRVEIKRLTSEFEQAEEELWTTKQELDFVMYELDMRRNSGDDGFIRHQNQVIAEQKDKIRHLHKALGKTSVGTKGPPAVTKTLYNEFKVFVSLNNDNIYKNFLRQTYGTTVGWETLKGYADLECEQRVAVSDLRSYYRRLSARSKERSAYAFFAARKAKRLREETKGLLAIQHNAYRARVDEPAKMIRSLDYNQLGKETESYRKWSERSVNKHKVNYLRVINKQFNFEPSRTNLSYAKWWANRVDKCLTDYYRTTATGKAVEKGIGVWNKFCDLMNTELNPKERARKKQEAEARTKLKAERLTRKEQATLAKAKRKEKARQDAEFKRNMRISMGLPVK